MAKWIDDIEAALWQAQEHGPACEIRCAEVDRLLRVARAAEAMLEAFDNNKPVTAMKHDEALRTALAEEPAE